MRMAGDGAVGGFLQSLKNLGTMRLTAIAGGGVAVLAFVIYMMARLSSPPMELLYGNLDLKTPTRSPSARYRQGRLRVARRRQRNLGAGAISKLDLRVKLADQALPSGGSVTAGYELFDKADMLGSTSFMQNVNLLRAMEGELARTIRSIERREVGARASGAAAARAVHPRGRGAVGLDRAEDGRRAPRSTRARSRRSSTWSPPRCRS